MLTTNVRSLPKHFSEIESIVGEFKPDIVTLAEVWKPYKAGVTIEGYHEIITKLRPNGIRGGGVGIYLSRKYKYEKVENINNLNLKKIEIVSIRMISNETKTIIIAVYRPPDVNTADTLSDLEKILKEIGNENVIITGDLNIDLASPNSLGEKYSELLLSHNLIQFVKAFTRITATSQTIIDHVSSNINTIDTTVCHQNVADHQLILTTWGKKESSKNEQVNQEGKKQQQKHLHYKDTIIKLQNYNWEKWLINTKSLDLNETYNSFNNIMQSSLVYETNKPKKQIPRQPWMTQEILFKKFEVDKHRKKFLKNKNERNEVNYKTLKKEYNKILQTTKINYYSKKLKEAGKDSKKTWTIINQLIKRKSKSETHKKIIYNNSEIEGDLETATILSNYYKSAAIIKIKQLKTESNFEEFLSTTDKKTDKFNLKQITREETWCHIKSVPPKPSSGFDNIPSKLINAAAATLAAPLTEIINKCFSTGSFPEKLKMAKITPVLKKEPPEPGNFRPISQLSCISKVIEKAALSQLNRYLTNNFTDETQFAYKKHHGTVHPILQTRHIIEQELEKGNYVCLALLDLSLAFDTLECENILPAKLKHYGSTPVTVNFFRNFFTNRTQITEWNGVQSDPIDLYNHSCVQGSCLGPQIYNHYTQDLNKVTKCHSIMFADDTNYILSDKDPNLLIEKMNEELEKTYKYMTANTLLINKQKSQYILFKPKKTKKTEITKKLMIRDTEIQRVEKARYLGVWFDEKLKFDTQFEMVQKKLEDTVKALICTRKILNYKAKFLIYNALFKSHIDYCAITYMDKLTKTQMTKLEKLQKKAIRLMFKARMNVHTGKLFRLSNITPIGKLYENEAVKFVYKYVSELYKYDQPLAIRKIILNASKNERTRLHDDKSKIKMKNNFKAGQCMFNLIDTWNKTKNQYRMAGNLWSLKKMIKEEVLNEIKLCTAKKCYMCNLDKHVNYEKRMQ